MHTRAHLPLRWLAAVLLLLAACDGGSPAGPEDEVLDRSEMLGRASSALILPAYAALQQAVDALDAAAARFAAAPSEAALADVQGRLRAARLAWQDASLYGFGPAEAAALRASLNTYPVDEGRVEANIQAGSYLLGAVGNRAAVGFPALDYLLHGVGATPSAVLAAYSTSADAANRRTYLLDNVRFVKKAVDDTVAGWAAGGGDYVGTFLSAAKGGTDVGSSLGMLLNAYVLHYERFLRDGKIGIPAGVRSAGVPRPAATEARYAGYSAELAVANLRAARRLFLGNGLDGSTGIGLDDHLKALGAATLATRIVKEFDEAVTALEVLSDPLSAQIERDNAPVLAAFREMQDVIVLLKADLTSVLGVTVTYQDNDGD